MSKESNLDKLRSRIDAIDEQLLTLLSERAGVAMEVAQIKRAEDSNAEFYRPEREAQVLRNILEKNEGPVADQDMARLFREIMSVCLALEERMNVAYLGPEGTFTQAAALKHFGHAVKTVPQNSIADVFRDVESGVCQYGVVPIENSIEGAVNHTLDMLISSGLEIAGEVQLRIHHNLLGKSDIDSIRVVYSHQQSLAQCRSWLDHHLKGVERVAVNSNAEAARRLLEENNCAAIAGNMAASLYDLPILAANIEDEANNTTRFLVLGKKHPGQSGTDKTSLLFAVANEPGALQQALACISDNEANMSRIESRPSRQTIWEYVFFVDIDGHIEEENIAAVVEQLRKTTPMLKLLGSYPVSVL